MSKSEKTMRLCLRVSAILSVAGALTGVVLLALILIFLGIALN